MDADEVTQILQAAERGDPQAAGQLLPLVYQELRRLAEQKLAAEPAGQTLQATALVHEAFLRLRGAGANDKQINFGDVRYPRGTGLALAAMAHHRLRHADDAAKSLEAAERLSRECAQPGKTDLGYGPDNGCVWQIWLREARAVVGGDTAAAG
jgi:hypothetical protein